MIKEENKWQIGNGSTVRVWEDNWFATGPLKRTVSPKPEGCSIPKVKYLLNQEGKGWNKELINHLFSHIKASSKMSMPISSLGLIDRLIWKHSPNGQYSVQSGYNMIEEKKRIEKNAEGSSVKGEEDRIVWGKIWGLCIKGRYNTSFGRLATIVWLLEQTLRKRGSVWIEFVGCVVRHKKQKNICSFNVQGHNWSRN